MTGLVGNLTTTTEYQVIPFRKGSYKTEMTLGFCNTSGYDNHLWIRWRRGENQCNLYFNYPVLKDDTYPRDQTPFKLTINLGDTLEAKSEIPGIDLFLVS